MFQSVIDQPGLRATRLGTGTGVSLLVHAGVFAAVLFLSMAEPEPPPEKEPVVVFRPPQPPRGNPNPPAPKPAAQTPKPKPPKPKKLVQPTVIPPTPPPEVEPPEQSEPEPMDEADPELPYIPGSDPNGVDIGGVPGVPAVTGIGGAIAMMEPTGEEIYPFGDGMQPPKLQSGTSIDYTREALAARVEGLLIAKCVITRQGDVEDCRIIKGLPYMNAAVIEALERRRYSPVRYQGRPIGVSYTFNVRLKLPR